MEFETPINLAIFILRVRICFVTSKWRPGNRRYFIELKSM